MKIDESKKNKLKAFLKTLLTEKELEEIANQDSILNTQKDVSSIKTSVRNLEYNVNGKLTNLERTVDKKSTTYDEKIRNLERVAGRIKPVDYAELLEALEKMTKNVGSLKLQEKVDRDYSPAYKMMIEKLSSVDSKVGGWKYPQYAYTGIRNKSFSPIDPANNGIGIESYDALTLTQATLTDTYKFYTGGVSGTLVSTVVITFTDSGKGTISTVVRT